LPLLKIRKMTVVYPFDDLINFIVKLVPNEVLAFSASASAIQRVQHLTKRHQENIINEAEELELESYLIQEDIMIFAKTRAKKYV